MVCYIEYLCREAEWVGSCRENNNKNGKDRVQEAFQSIRTKLGKDGEGGINL